MRKLMNKKLNKKGFTLMEMLIVVAIIAILVAIAIPTFTKSLNAAKKSADMANLRAVYAEKVADALTSGTTVTAPTFDSTKKYEFTVAGSKYQLQYPSATATATVTGDNLVITYHADKDYKIPGSNG